MEKKKRLMRRTIIMRVLEDYGEKNVDVQKRKDNKNRKIKPNKKFRTNNFGEEGVFLYIFCAIYDRSFILFL